MDKFFQYSKDKNDGKYTEMTREEFLRTQNDADRWFLNFGSSVLECEKEAYQAYMRAENHYKYAQRNAAGKKAEVISLEFLYENYTYDMSVFAVHNEPSPEDIVMEQMYFEYRKKRLFEALETLSSEELYLIQEITLKCRKQRDLADEFKVSQQAISQKYVGTLKKLRRLLKDFER